MFAWKTIGCALAMGLVTAFGCSGRPARVNPPAIDAEAAGAKAVERYGKDGRISAAELDKCAALKAAMAQIDTDGDGAVTAGEITARIQAWQESKLAQVSVTCTVLRNGRPLAGAEVKFVPEEFLGENLKAASGTTSESGTAMIRVAGGGPEGDADVAPGLYRVEITKVGERIPAKYNTNTTLGQEVALDAAGIAQGIRFDLRY